MTTTFENLTAGDSIEGPKFAVSRESIRLFCDASLDYNPLHLDDDYMKGSFGKTNFGGIIMHGMNNFGLISRMITDWAYPAGAIHRRLETRWVKPVRPGDTIQPTGIVKSKQVTKNSRWVLIDVMVRNQNGEKVATGEAMVEFPLDLLAVTPRVIPGWSEDQTLDVPSRIWESRIRVRCFASPRNDGIFGMPSPNGPKRPVPD